MKFILTARHAEKTISENLKKRSHAAFLTGYHKPVTFGAKALESRRFLRARS